MTARILIATLLIGGVLGWPGDSQNPLEVFPEAAAGERATARGDVKIGFAISPYIQDAGQTHMTIMWTSRVKSDARVRYGSGRTLDGTVEDPAVQEVRCPGPYRIVNGRLVMGPESTEYVYRVRLEGLKSGTLYRYAVELGGTTKKAAFTTVPKTVKEFTFIAYGDSRSNPPVHESVADGFRQFKPAFILHTGDMVGSGFYHEWQPQFFEPLEHTISHIPLWPARGNHEGTAESMRQLLVFPDACFWYSFDYGNAHFVSLDSCNPAEEAKMLAWCEKDLAASKARWKFAFYHLPSYDMGTHKSQWGRTTFVPLFRKYGVDVVLTGHTHAYERFRPMYTPGENDTHPVTHIVTAGGGAPLYSVDSSPFLAASALKHHFIVFTIEGDTLSGRAVTPDGKVIDTFEIAKPDGVYDKAYLKKAFVEKKLAEQTGIDTPLPPTPYPAP